MTQKHIALATYHRDPKLPPPHDIALADPLTTYGIQAEEAVWNDPDVDWSHYDAVIVRSTWDYHHQVEAFTCWLKSLQAQHIPVFNPADLMIWNSDKVYLKALAEQGIPTVPTVWGEKDTAVEAVMAAKAWTKVLVKPRFGASAHGIQIVSQAADCTLPTLEHSMIQPLMEQITKGEYSLIFFSGEYAHTVLKRPAQGKLFVQEEHGGQSIPVLADASMIQQARRVLEATASLNKMLLQDILYARVDGVRDGDTFLLMELELIEPDLFLTSANGVVEQFANCIAEALYV